MTYSEEQSTAEITKEELFCTPALISAKLSPNGNFIAEVGADEEGIPNVFIKDVSSKERKQITFFITPEIIQFFWSANNDRILLLRDEDGSAQLHLHGIDIHSKDHVIYTQRFSFVNTKVVQISSKENRAVIGLNHRNLHFHDLYLLDLNTGEWGLLLENNTFAKFLFSDHLELILKMKINDDGTWTVFTEKDEIFMELSSEDAFQTEFLSYKDGIVYLLDNRHSNTNQLISKSLQTGEEKILGSHPISDVDEVLFLQGKPVAYASYDTQKQWHVLDRSLKSDFEFLEKKVGLNFEITSQTKQGDSWIIASSIPDKGAFYWIYKRNERALVLLYQSQVEASMAKMYEMVISSRDGKRLVCYYTLPKEFDKGGFVERPIPLVVVPHGGPFKVRDKFEFNPFHQWLAQCGYAVLSVNFRLSSGFGKDFVTAGNGEYGKKAHLDVIDGVEACIFRGITQKGKLAIFGGSYGGFETLASLTFSPEYFNCCVSICGPSNLKTVLDNVPQFWEFTAKPLSDKLMFFTKQAFITSMGGHPDDPEGIKYLEKCSPLNHLENIKAPLLLIHGQHDHIVNEKESRQIYESMKKNGKQATYILMPDEGHRPAKFANKMLFLDYAERFLSQHLGGKYCPVDQSILSRSKANIYDP